MLRRLLVVLPLLSMTAAASEAATSDNTNRELAAGVATYWPFNGRAYEPVPDNSGNSPAERHWTWGEDNPCGEGQKTWNWGGDTHPCPSQPCAPGQRTWDWNGQDTPCPTTEEPDTTIGSVDFRRLAVSDEVQAAAAGKDGYEPKSDAVRALEARAARPTNYLRRGD